LNLSFGFDIVGTALDRKNELKIEMRKNLQKEEGGGVALE